MSSPVGCQERAEAQVGLGRASTHQNRVTEPEIQRIRESENSAQGSENSPRRITVENSPQALRVGVSEFEGRHDPQGPATDRRRHLHRESVEGDAGYLIKDDYRYRFSTSAKEAIACDKAQQRVPDRCKEKPEEFQPDYPMQSIYCDVGKM